MGVLRVVRKTAPTGIWPLHSPTWNCSCQVEKDWYLIAKCSLWATAAWDSVGWLSLTCFFSLVSAFVLPSDFFWLLSASLFLSPPCTSWDFLLVPGPLALPSYTSSMGRHIHSPTYMLMIPKCQFLVPPFLFFFFSLLLCPNCSKLLAVFPFFSQAILTDHFYEGQSLDPSCHLLGYCCALTKVQIAHCILSHAIPGASRRLGLHFILITMDKAMSADHL